VNNVVIYQNDHLGTPQKLTAINGAVLWAAKYSSFGQADVALSSTIANNLRFPGQYFDAETGLHYNWHRYYDSDTGKYLRSDPVGFLGGDLNLSAYSSNNPINGIDPLGLQQYNAATAYHLLHHGYRPPQMPKRADKPKEDSGTYDQKYEFWTTEKLSSCEVNGVNKCRVLYNTEIEIHNKYWLDIIQMDLGGDTKRPSQARLSTVVSKAIDLRMIRDVYENCIRKRIEECGGCKEKIRFDYESILLP
jgi:RHS repeat-associated protein